MAYLLQNLWYVTLAFSKLQVIFSFFLKSGIDKRTFVRYNNKTIVAAGSGAYAV